MPAKTALTRGAEAAPVAPALAPDDYSEWLLLHTIRALGVVETRDRNRLVFKLAQWADQKIVER